MFWDYWDILGEFEHLNDWLCNYTYRISGQRHFYLGNRLGTGTY